MSEAANNEVLTGLGTWFRASLFTFAVAGTGDWALAWSSSTGVGPVGLATGWVVFVGLWMLGATLWAFASATALWLATGSATLNPLFKRLTDGARRWWNERHSEADATRLASFAAVVVALGLFVAASVAISAHLIEERNIPWLIAATILAVQLALATGCAVLALTLRRGLRALFSVFRRRGWLGFINTPTVGAASLIVAISVALFGLTNQSDVYFAVEGPALSLLIAAVALHPVVAFFFGGKIGQILRLPLWARGLSWATPLAALIAVGAVSQQAEARRLLVLHGEAANFAFNAMQRHADLDRLFDRSDCPPLGSDGLPADGTSNEEYEEQCMDPSYDRPFQREEIPVYERPEFEASPSFVFITWDAVRVDRLGFMGHDRDTTPNLDRFAERSLVFDRAFAADSGTGPSFWSLMAGKTPFQVDLVDGKSFPPPISEDETMFGELLEEAGYRNEAVMCGAFFGREDWGIRRGFAAFDNVCDRDLSHLAPRVTEQSIETFERLADGDEPFFLWVHYFDPHHPYNSHPDIGYGDDELDRYDEELTYTDKHFQKLLEVIDDRSAEMDRPLYTIMSADHGENFDEHGSDPHARNLYRIVTQVPKIVHGPHIEPRRVDAPVALGDVHPSLLDLAGVDIPEDTTMVSQVPVYFGADADPDRMVFQENSYSRPRRHTRAVVYDRYHYIMDLTTNSNELYDYIDDPIERNNLIGTGLIEERIMRQALVRFLQTSTIPDGMED